MLWLSTAAWPTQLKQMFTSIYTENGAFVLRGPCLCPEELKPVLPAISVLSLVYRVVLHPWGNTAGCCMGSVSLQGFLSTGPFGASDKAVQLRSSSTTPCPRPG